MALPAPAAPVRRRRPRIARWVVLGAIVAASCFVTGLLLAPVDLTVPPPPASSVILDAAGRNVVATIRSPELRIEVKPEEIPDVMRQAIVAAEDKRFFEHRGVDFIALVRALAADLRAGGVKQGGSTITQQYVKNVYVGREKTLLRKVKEAALAVRLERQKSKEEILTAYLNGVFFGNGVYGVEAAAKYYFGKRARQLTLGESAMLAGVVPAPSARNPVRNWQVAKENQINTLNAMTELGFIDVRQASAALKDPGVAGRTLRKSDLVRQRDPELPTEAPEFADMVKEELKEQLLAQFGDLESAEQVLYSGLRVKTTIDLLMQRAVRRAVQSVLPGASDPDAAVVVLDPRNGDLKAIHSSRYTRGGLNLAEDGRRSPGSVMKVFALTEGLQSRKVGPDDVFRDPACYRYGRGKDDVACNYEETGGGSKSLRRATWKSSNTVYMQVSRRIGTGPIAATARRMGVAGRIDTGATMVLGGGVEVTPLSVTRALATLANDGVRHDVRTVVEVRRGDGVTNRLTGPALIEEEQPRGARAVPIGVARQVRDILKGVVQQGTATAARQSFEVFGKTGTKDNNSDAWFVGCGEGQNLCIGVWLGYREGLKPMKRIHGVRQVTGGTLPARIFDQFWTALADVRAEQAALSEEAEEEEVIGDTDEPSASPTARRRRRPTQGPDPTVEPTQPTTRPSPTSEPPRSTSPSPTPQPVPTLTSSSPEPSGSPSASTGPS